MAARCTLLKQQQQLNSSLYQHITAPAPLTSTRACLQIKRPHARIRIKRPALFLSLATGMAGWLGKRTQPQPAQHLCACGTRLVCLAALGREPNVRSECALEAGPTKAVCHAVYSACPGRDHACSCNRRFAFPSLGCPWPQKKLMRCDWDDGQKGGTELCTFSYLALD